MSLVGPRPHIADMPVLGTDYEHLVPYYGLRFDMRPGITGWAQANGLRGPIPDEALALERIDHDLAYIQNFSLALDLRILWLTLRREFLTGTGR
jgi:lipopolysaccharide/colanic/teichoic acid biosynthesis glycosyltransferase